MSDDTVEILGTGIDAITPGDPWSVRVGPETERFLSRLRKDQQGAVRSEAVTILSRCLTPTNRDKRAGLIVGYVQSGKTTSFTAVSTLAADNGYGLVVIIGGISNALLEQTRNRIARDLDLDSLDAYRRWVQVKSPKKGTNEAQALETALRDWAEEGEADERVPAIVTLMKHHKHMDDFADVLEEMHGVDLGKVTALIIDDEADQATPNLKRSGSVSATYSRLRKIRAKLPSHTLLQYTATPQAPLLVSIADEISPDFVCTLRPGVGYTGGKYFFKDHKREFVRHISAKDLAIIDGDEIDPPDSLIQAFAVFVLGAAMARIRGDEVPPQMSMLVHPSQRTLPQAKFINWLKAMRDRALVALELPTSDLDRHEHIVAVWEPAYQELCRTVTDVPDLEAALQKALRVLRKIVFQEVNATPTGESEIRWSTGPYWVLVGGQLLDRGFTVEGLTVTYMPRGLGVGNADTVQQRARFFGYKEAYAKLCRAYLDSSVDRAFSNYVRHEERLRKELSETASAGGSLKEWKRVFLLDSSLKPTRQGVMRLSMMSIALKENWFSQRDFSDSDIRLIDENRRNIDRFVSQLEWKPFSSVSGPLPSQKHKVATVPLKLVLSDCLANYVMWGEDATRFTGVRVMLEEAESESASGGLMCDVVEMAPELERRRRRTLNSDGRVKNLFQGQNPRTGTVVYGGDRAVRRSDVIALQLHRVDFTEDDGSDEGSMVVLEDVPVLAISIPLALQSRVLVER